MQSPPQLCGLMRCKDFPGECLPHVPRVWQCVHPLTVDLHVPCTENDSADFGGIVFATLCTRELHRVRYVAVLVECIVPACDRSGGRGRGASPATFTSSQGRCSLDE